MINVLIIDNNELMRDWVSNAVAQAGQRYSIAYTLADGLRKARSESFSVIFLDAHMPDGSGLDMIPKLKATGYSPEIVIFTGLGDPDEAELAIKNGAWDYIEKPASLESIKLHLTRILEYRSEKVSGKPGTILQRKDIIGSSNRLNASFEMLSQAAQSTFNVIITGETGTGKELFARAIHHNSSRSSGNFVIVDCTSLPETLVESILFGHVRGAFTNAYVSQDGLIKQADGGTLFLDEIGELPLSLQKSFLRVIQEHHFRPVGGKQEVTSDFRLVTATNRDLEEMVRKGLFREDLFFRLRSLVIELPPLRECRDDIKELTDHYMKVLCDRFGMPQKGFSPEFREVMYSYKWPGNVRELIQAIEKCLIAAKDEPILYPKHLPTHIRIQVARNGVHKQLFIGSKNGLSTATETDSLPKLKELRRSAIAESEKQYFKALISSVIGDINEACRVSGLSRSRLYTLLKKYRINSTL